jgi:hypothetical protein
MNAKELTKAAKKYEAVPQTPVIITPKASKKETT